MNVSLTPYLEAMIQQKVQSGRYNNASEVVRAGLRLLEEHEQRHKAELQALRADIAAGKASGTPKPADEVFSRLEAKYSGQADAQSR